MSWSCLAAFSYFCSTMHGKEMIENNYFTWKYMKGTLTTSSFNFFFVLFLIIHQTEMKMTPHFIHVSTAFFLKSEVFLPLEIYHHKKTDGTVKWLDVTFFFIKEFSFGGGMSQNHCPRYFNTRGEEQNRVQIKSNFSLLLGFVFYFQFTLIKT